MNAILQKDLYRYEGHRSTNLLIKLKYIMFVPGFTYIYFLRKVQFSSFKVTRLFYLVFLKITSYVTHIQIPPAVKIAPGFRIVHFGTIVINPNTIIGKNFNISQGALIGNSLGKNAGTPIIGNNVCINANAIIIGNCRIGNDVLIAPGAFVNFDVPDNSIVIGNPGKIIEKTSSPTRKYIVYPIPEE